MESSGYAGGESNAYERSKLAARGLCAVAELAAIVSVTYSAIAQDLQTIAYKETNLAQYRVPSVEGGSPFRTVYGNLTDQIAGNETRADFHEVDGTHVGIFSINGKQFHVALDYHRKHPLDAAYTGRSAVGRYKEYDSKARR